MTIAESIEALNPAFLLRANPEGPGVLAPRPVTATNVTAVPGIDEPAMHFDGAAVIAAEEPDFMAEREFSLFAWIRVAPSDSQRRIIGRENGRTGVTLSVDADGTAVIRWSTTSGNYSYTRRSATRVDDGEWHFIAATFAKRYTTLGFDTRGVNYRLYVDGVSEQLHYFQPGLFGSTVNLSMTSDVVIGRSAARTQELVGDVQAVGYFDRTLPAAEVRAMWQARPTVDDSGIGWGILAG